MCLSYHTRVSNFAPASSKEFLDIQEAIECGFTLKRVCNMIRTYNQMLNHLKKASLTKWLSIRLRTQWLSVESSCSHFYIASLATQAAINPKATEIENKIPDTTGFITSLELNRKKNDDAKMKEATKSLPTKKQVDAALDVKKIKVETKSFYW